MGAWLGLPSSRVKATSGWSPLPSLPFFTPPPVWGQPEECAVSVKDGKLVFVAADREWAFELYLDAVFEEVMEAIDGAPSPTLLCKCTKPGRSAHPAKLHFGSDGERASWKGALERARDAAQRA